MSKRYHVKVNEQWDFDFSEEEIRQFDLQNLPNHSFHGLEENKSFKAAITQHNFIDKVYNVSINANPYTVAIQTDLDRLISEMGLELNAGAMVNEIKAPMPGLIIEVNVKPGDEVKEGDYLMVLEAMKMENALTAPRDAKIKHIAINKGETVEKNQLLIEME
ncbi:acetyl-CoA carboxylase biotin carboxyl carrier protein subunit [uncultured Mesonia sp.]|uniref:acetyl-CoA carboxylase biotin carboxyl carrier protein subunit n=1 Tax=uncultured Mesonia sp. TaxID=399731 RepID=UPI00374E247C